VSGNYGIWLLELARGTVTRFTQLPRLTYPISSPTGREIVFGHFEPGSNMDLYIGTIDGRGPEKMLLHVTKQGSNRSELFTWITPRWSPRVYRSCRLSA
jgi:hypothetical protein